MLLRLTITLLSIIFIWLQYSLWLGKNNLRDYYRLQQEISQQRLLNTDTIKENQRIWAEVHALTYGTATLEELARSKLNMMKSDEIFYYMPQHKVMNHNEIR